MYPQGLIISRHLIAKSNSRDLVNEADMGSLEFFEDLKHEPFKRSKFWKSLGD